MSAFHKKRTGRARFRTYNMSNTEPSPGSTDRNYYKLLREKAKRNDQINHKKLQLKQKKTKKCFNHKKATKKSKSRSTETCIEQPTTLVQIESKCFKIGDQIVLKPNQLRGTICYAGTLKKSNHRNRIYYGIELNKNKGNCDGSFKGKSYFKTSRNYGIFVTKDDIQCMAYCNDDEHEDKYIKYCDNNQLLLEFFWQILPDLMPFLDNICVCSVLSIKMGFESSVNCSFFGISFVIDSYRKDLADRMNKLNQKCENIHFRMWNLVNYDEIKNAFECDDNMLDCLVLDGLVRNVMHSFADKVYMGSVHELMDLYAVREIHIDPISVTNAVGNRCMMQQNQYLKYDYISKSNDMKIVSKQYFHDILVYDPSEYDALKEFFMIPILQNVLKKWIIIQCIGKRTKQKPVRRSDYYSYTESFSSHFRFICAWLSNECVITVAQKWWQ